MFEPYQFSFLEKVYPPNSPYLYLPTTKDALFEFLLTKCIFVDTEKSHDLLNFFDVQMGLLLYNWRKEVYVQASKSDKKLLDYAKNHFDGVIFRLLAALEFMQSDLFDFQIMVDTLKVHKMLYRSDSPLPCSNFLRLTRTLLSKFHFTFSSLTFCMLSKHIGVTLLLTTINKFENN